MNKVYQIVLNRTDGTNFADGTIYANREYALDIVNLLNRDGDIVKEGKGVWVLVDRVFYK